MLHRHAWLALALALASATAALPAHAADVGLPADSTWHPFTVDSLLAPASPPALNLAWIDDSGDPLHFTFVIGAGLVGTLTVLDTGFAGDTFKVMNFGSVLGTTSAVPVQSFDPSAAGVEDFGAALADPHFSRGTFSFGAGSYSVSGLLDQSLLLDGVALDSTSGGVRLAVTAVPEPSALALLLAGLAATASLTRRRRSKSQ